MGREGDAAIDGDERNLPAISGADAGVIGSGPTQSTAGASLPAAIGRGGRARSGAGAGRVAQPESRRALGLSTAPDGLWRAAFNGEREYPTSTGEDRYRRGLYVFLRRTVPNPTLAIFDAPSRETCTFRRLPTNTPLQAFVTLNDPVYVEAARGLARRILREGGEDDHGRVRYALRLCLGRPPNSAQEEIVMRHLEAELAHYGRQVEAARELIAEPSEPAMTAKQAGEMAAWTSVANVLLNLDALMNRG